ATSDFAAAASACCVAVVALAYSAEVVARYFFNSPLNWSGDISSYLLLACVFLALPKVTSEAGHVAVSVIQDRLGPEGSLRYGRAVSRLTGVFCLITAYFVAMEGLRQFNEHVLSSQSTQIPKWWLAALACFGLASAALHFLFPGQGVESTG
ncbi:MAG: TRAP transporter small permease, partial [Burkholderiales bacterium]